MYKFLFLSMRYVYEACNPTIVNLSTDQNMISLGFWITDSHISRCIINQHQLK